MRLEDKLKNGTAVFGVVGLGYVGLPLAVEMGKAGNNVIGFEVSAEKANSVNAGESYIPDVSTDELADLVKRGILRATTDFSQASECDAIAICVPTPLDKMRDPDVSFMVSAAREIAPHITADTLVTLESTTYPGTTEEILKPIIESTGLKVGESVFLAFSPERIDPGNPVYQTKNTPKVVGGCTPKCTKLAVMFYERFLTTIVPVSSSQAAEMTKLLENIFRCVNIALVNELAQLANRMNIDIWEVIDAAKTKPFGFMPFYPGPGLGGHCIPVDPFYLSWKAREFDFQTEFIDLAGKVNEDMPYFVVERLMNALNAHRKPLAGSRVLVLGVAYKSNVGDMRESPATKVIDLMAAKEAEIVYHDPFVDSYNYDGLEIERVELTAEEIEAADVVLVLTAHRNVDYALVARHAKLVFDTRNVMGSYDSPNVILL
ncbi:MAG: nucleotide sugar dehydrogenase [Coriobacteriia bacterium]|nr:nucleotide sugar dehydrogenase [Coriobacteriia bacterium]